MSANPKCNLCGGPDHNSMLPDGSGEKIYGWCIRRLQDRLEKLEKRLRSPCSHQTLTHDQGVWRCSDCGSNDVKPPDLSPRHFISADVPGRAGPLIREVPAWPPQERDTMADLRRRPCREGEQVKELRLKSRCGKPVSATADDDGSIKLAMQWGAAPWTAEVVTLDAASVAKLRDWLAEDCCDMRRE